MAANYTIRRPEVVARQHHGGTLTIIHNHRGELHAKDGDWLVGPEDAQRGEVDVLTNDDFNRLYQPITPTETVAQEQPKRKAKE